MRFRSHSSCSVKIELLRIGSVSAVLDTTSANIGKLSSHTGKRCSSFAKGSERVFIIVCDFSVYEPVFGKEGLTLKLQVSVVDPQKVRGPLRVFGSDFLASFLQPRASYIAPPEKSEHKEEESKREKENSASGSNSDSSSSEEEPEPSKYWQKRSTGESSRRDTGKRVPEPGEVELGQLDGGFGDAVKVGTVHDWPAVLSLFSLCLFSLLTLFVHSLELVPKRNFERALTGVTTAALWECCLWDEEKESRYRGPIKKA